MVSLTCSVSRTEGVTLVTGRLVNEGRACRVRVETQLDGPVWPPRQRGRPVAGWDDDGFECVLAAEETRAIGYASPAPPVEPPMTVTETEPVESDTDEHAFEPSGCVPTVEETPDGVVRALGSPVPPRDAVPDAGPVAVEPQPRSSGVSSQPDPAAPADVDDAAVEPAPGDQRDTTPERATADAVEAWLTAVATRVERAETLADATRVPEATDAVAAAGGLEGVRSLDEQLSTDATRLRDVADRAARLADRAEAVEVPVETLARLA